MADTLVRITESFPFDSAPPTVYDDYGRPVYDRSVGAWTLRETFKKFFTDGIFPNPGTALSIEKGSGLSITIQPGIGIIRGAMGGVCGDPITLQLSDSAPKGNICYSVFLRSDENDDKRSMYFRISASDPGPDPQPAAPFQDTVVKELRLGYITVPSGSTDLANAKVVNEKGLSVCPFASPFEEIDVDAIVSDFRTSANEALANLIELFERHKDLINSALDETTAGHLQTQIDSLKSQLDNFDLAGSVDDTTIKYGMKPGSAKKELYIPDGAITGKLIGANAVGKDNIDSTLVELIETKPVGLDLNAYTIEELANLVANTSNTTESLRYLVGKEKTITLSGLGTFPFRVIGVRQDTLRSGGNNCITFQCCNIIANHNMNSTDTTSGGYAKSAMKNYIDSTVYNSLPDDIKKYVVQVNKKMASTKGGDLATVQCKAFIATMFEVYGSRGNGTANEGQHYEYWALHPSVNDHKMTLINSSSAYYWWTSSVYDSTYFCGVSSDGNTDYDSASNSYGVVPCFCIGKS